MRKIAGLEWHWSSILGAVALFLVAVAPLVFSKYALFLMTQILLAAYIAVSFDFAYSYGRILSFVQGAFFGLGAYSSVHLAAAGVSGLITIGTASAVLAAVSGTAIGLILVRMKGAHGPPIATIIVASIVGLASNSLTQVTGGEDGIGLARADFHMLGTVIPAGVNVQSYYCTAIPLIAIVAVSWALQPTRFWKVLRAVGQNERRAQQLGFDVRSRRLVVFVFSAATAGIGGALYTITMQHVTTSVFDLSLSLNAILWATVGGLSDPFGAFIGALFVYPTTELLSSIFKYVDIAVGALLVLVAMFFPEGIIGAVSAWDERRRAGAMSTVAGSDTAKQLRQVDCDPELESQNGRVSSRESVRRSAKPMMMILSLADATKNVVLGKGD